MLINILHFSVSIGKRRLSLDGFIDHNKVGYVVVSTFKSYLGNAQIGAHKKTLGVAYAYLVEIFLEAFLRYALEASRKIAVAHIHIFLRTHM